MHFLHRAMPCGLVVSLVVGSLVLLVPAGNAQDLRFEQITTADGLSNASVTSLAQDHEGFMWIGTQEGLNKYDGYDFEVFRHHPLDSTTLTNNRIESLLVDHAGVLWIGTAEGLNRYDREHNRFIRYVHNPDDPHSLTPGQINILVADHANRLWVGTQNGGLFRYEPDRDNFTRFLDDPADPNNVLDTEIRTLVEDRQEFLWIGTGEPFDPAITGEGLLRFDPETGSTKRFLHAPGNPSSLVDNRVSALFEDRQGLLWVGTCGSGLHQYDPASEAFIRMEPDAADPNRLYAPQAEVAPLSGCPHVRIIHEDQAGMFWIGTLYGGLNRFDPATNTLTHYTGDPSDPASPINNAIWTFYEDRHGTLWLGNLTGGLAKLDRYARKFSTYLHDPNVPGSISNGRVEAIYEAPSEPGVLWIGTGSGLNRLDRRTGQMTVYENNPNDARSLGDNYVNAIYEDRDAALWIGTSAGLDRMDRQTGQFEHFRHDPADPNSLSAGSVETLYEDNEGVLWLGNFSSGLSRFDRERTRFVRYELPAVTGVRTFDQSVFVIYEDTAGTLWVGTYLGGLYRLDRETDTFIPVLEGTGVISLHEDALGRFWVGTENAGLLLFDRASGDFRAFAAQEGFPSNRVYNILEDEQGHLWLSTDNGLSQFDPQTNTFVNYDVSDGLPSNSFSYSSAHTGTDNRLYFGSIDGLVSFHPDQINENPHPPEVVLTGLKIFNTQVEPDAEASPHEEHLTLTHAQNDLTLEYVGLHFANSLQNQYRYMLEGYDGGWIDAGTQRSARYTNLSPDDYVFRVQAANSDGVWNEEGAAVRVTITPPWWRTWWAYSLYGLLFGVGVFAVDRFQRRRLLHKERERTRERELEQAREIERAYHDLRETKDRLVQQEKMASLGQLTAGIAHEIKNPLNFVNNFAEVNIEMAQELREAYEANPDIKIADLLDIVADLEQNAGVIAQHGKRADGIVHAMMQHASGGSGQREPTDINALVSEHLELAYHGKRVRLPDFMVTIDENLDAEVGEAEVVPQEIGRVLLNLFGNAFDAVYEHAQQANGSYEPRMTVSTRRVERTIEIRVADNGLGIAAAIREKIFEPFFTTKPTGSGTGLGLSLAYDIVTQGHGGTLTVEGAEGEGATFIITLPKRKREAAVSE